MSNREFADKILEANPEIGVFEGMPDKEYRAIPALSQSTLKDFFGAPGKWIKSPPRAETSSMKWGNLVDTRVLTPELFLERYFIRDEPFSTGEKHWNRVRAILHDRYEGQFVLSPFKDFRKKEAREWRDAQLAEGKEIVTPEEDALAREHAGILAKGMTIISEEERQEVEKANAALRENDFANGLLENCKTQVAVVWIHTDPTTGVSIPCKCLIDIVDKGALADLKTAMDASPRGFRSSVLKWRYDIQASFYLDGWNAATGEERDLFGFVVSESSFPYETATYYLDQWSLNIGRNGDTDRPWLKGYKQMLGYFLDCVTSNQFPGYTTGWTELEL